MALNISAAVAFYGPSTKQSLSTYNLAIQVATHLYNPKLLAKTYYHLGRTYSGLNQLSRAIQSDEKTREYFQQAGL